MNGADNNIELELRFIKLAYSSLLKTVQTISNEMAKVVSKEMAKDVDVSATVRQHMLTICDGVRARALGAAADDIAPEAATAQVDALINTINEYFDYSDSPLFPPIELVRRES
jgi:prophage DNA circulation protein